MKRQFALKLLLVTATASASIAFAAPKNQEAARWDQEARNVTIIRDNWGIAHI
jgi:acyl-homoserine lactone acylase PvdQ